ncbi:hypothetical protein HYC85_016706 [Camellia sinensis]|uniref:Uncharacterized protein n=1 Tax=Camellia sinensis TaxID=4442 RepID=A0A7J7H438_CAMSI|nr:hypothetical protein HYC85_016706 [Camellia sinensis]
MVEIKAKQNQFSRTHSQLTARRCQECGQTLPPTYQPPADEDWSTGIFGCTEDTDSLTGLFCPCVLFGRNVENLNADISQRAACVGHIIYVEGGMTFVALTSVLNGIDPQTLFLIYEGLFFAWWMCGIYTSMARQSLQRKYHLKQTQKPETRGGNWSADQIFWQADHPLWSPPQRVVGRWSPMLITGRWPSRGGVSAFWSFVQVSEVNCKQRTVTLSLNCNEPQMNKTGDFPPGTFGDVYSFWRLCWGLRELDSNS